MHRKQHRKSRKIKTQGNVLQTIEKYKAPETNINEIEIHDLPDRKFKITVRKTLTEVSRAKK